MIGAYLMVAAALALAASYVAIIHYLLSHVERRDLSAEGLLTCNNDRVALTRRGLLQADRLLPLFYDSPYRKVRYA